MIYLYKEKTNPKKIYFKSICALHLSHRQIGRNGTSEKKGMVIIMYCINCGVKLEDTEKVCPLCGTVPFHPDIKRNEAESLYPENRFPKHQMNTLAVMVMVTTMFIIPFIITLLCDLQINREVTWSGYVMGALLVAYVTVILPLWFRRPNPVIFVPCGFVSVGLYLWYINFAVGGDWFLGFAFPMVGGVGIIVTAVVALLRYVKKGKLYIFGGAALALGAFMPVLELLINITFSRQRFAFWSIYPLAAMIIMGGMLIFLAINRNVRESMERKFFI